MTDTKILHPKYTEHTSNTDQSALLSLQVQSKCIFHTYFPMDNLGIANNAAQFWENKHVFQEVCKKKTKTQTLKLTAQTLKYLTVNL